MARSIQVTFDAAQPDTLAEFWAEALGYVLQPPPDGFDSWEAWADEVGIPVEQREDLAAIVDPDGKGPRVLFQRVPEGKTAKNRVHLDVNVTARGSDNRAAEIDAEVDRLISLGAIRVAAFDDPTGTWTVMKDPEGNEFCVQ